MILHYSNHSILQYSSVNFCYQVLDYTILYFNMSDNITLYKVLLYGCYIIYYVVLFYVLLTYRISHYIILWQNVECSSFLAKHHIVLCYISLSQAVLLPTLCSAKFWHVMPCHILIYTSHYMIPHYVILYVHVVLYNVMYFSSLKHTVSHLNVLFNVTSVLFLRNCTISYSIDSTVFLHCFPFLCNVLYWTATYTSIHDSSLHSV